MEWSMWNWINVFFMVVCATGAKRHFEEDENILGWGNLIASAANAASIAAILL